MIVLKEGQSYIDRNGKTIIKISGVFGTGYCLYSVIDIGGDMIYTVRTSTLTYALSVGGWKLVNP